MGDVVHSYRATRRRSKPVDDQAERRPEVTDRRQMVRLDLNRICLHRSPRMVFPPDQGGETHDEGDSFTNKRMASVERGVSTTFHQVPDSSDHHPVCLSTGSSEPGGSACVSRMSSLSMGRTVFFDTDNITYFTPTDWSAEDYCKARKGEWAQIAADRFRFKRRIRDTELLIGKCIIR